MILLNFPNFNIYSTPLLVLVFQGLIFFVLLLRRYFQKNNLSDLLLALILLITCWHQTTYTIGFMGWYDSFRNTKINYFLISLSFASGPLIYFYVKSITHADFRLKKNDYYHFIPVCVFVLFKIFVYCYDAMQPGFEDTQNGYLRGGLLFDVVNPFTMVFFHFQKTLYLAFTLQLYYNYRQKIQQVFSNTFELELNWLRNFLYLYSFLFVYGVIQIVTDLAVTELSYKQEWWYFFFSALVIIYVGIKGYFTPTDKLNGIDFNNTNTFQILEQDTVTDISVVNAKSQEKNDAVSEVLLTQIEILTKYMETEKPFLNPDLNLIQLAKSLQMTRAQLSEIINMGFGKNFNDFINEYRVNAVKESLNAGKQKELSLLGIAYECGFNSKATFNRVFKKLTGFSPTQYINKN